MIHKIDHNNMGRSKLGWLTSWFHFSFAEYYNPANVHFGALRVINDDLIQPHTGFDTHPHNDMEIITYLVEGQLTHGDSMNNKSTLQRGEVQYMSAGTGIFHSERNEGDHPLRLLQIWILPDKAGHKPQYGEHRFPWAARENRWLPIVSGTSDAGGTGSAPIQIHQDMNLFVTELKDGNSLELEILPGRQGYLVLIEGEASLENADSGDAPIALVQRDAAEIMTGKLRVSAAPTAHILFFDMPRVFPHI